MEKESLLAASDTDVRERSPGNLQWSLVYALLIGSFVQPAS